MDECKPLVDEHKKLYKQMKGVPGVIPERFVEGGAWR